MTPGQEIEYWKNVAKEMYEDTNTPTEQDVIDFLRENPNPSDDKVHEWAEENGYETHELEAIFYSLATKYVKLKDKEDK